MRLTAHLASIFCVALVAPAVPAVAQNGPDIFVTPIANAPFTAVINVQRTVVQPNGAVVNLRSMREIARDSQGKIHNEARTLMPVTQSGTPAVLRVHIYDPQSRVVTYFYPPQQTFWIGAGNRPPATEPPDSYAAPAGEALPPSQYVMENDLGEREIEGLPVHGVRKTQKVSAENSAVGKAITITDEYWYSEDLRMNLLVKHSDPRTGSATLTVAKIVRTEPDQSFFQVPNGYRPGPMRQITMR